MPVPELTSSANRGTKLSWKLRLAYWYSTSRLDRRNRLPPPVAFEMHQCDFATTGACRDGSIMTTIHFSTSGHQSCISIASVSGCNSL